MSEAMEECQNCKKMLPEEKMATHFGYCRRNVKKCAQCGQMYDINFTEQHQQDYHRKEKCPHCKKQITPSDMNKHRSTCTLKPKFCEYCQQNIPVSEYPLHLRACQSRTKPCERCNKDIVNSQYFVHIATCEGIKEQPREKVITNTNPIPSGYRAQIDSEREKIPEKKTQAREVKQADYRKEIEPKYNLDKNYAPINYEHKTTTNYEPRKESFGQANNYPQRKEADHKYSVNYPQRRQANRKEVEAPRAKAWQEKRSEPNIHTSSQQPRSSKQIEKEKSTAKDTHTNKHNIGSENRIDNRLDSKNYNSKGNQMKDKLGVYGVKDSHGSRNEYGLKDNKEKDYDGRGIKERDYGSKDYKDYNRDREQRKPTANIRNSTNDYTHKYTHKPVENQYPGKEVIGEKPRENKVEGYSKGSYGVTGTDGRPKHSFNPSSNQNIGDKSNPIASKYANESSSRQEKNYQPSKHEPQAFKQGSTKPSTGNYGQGEQFRSYEHEDSTNLNGYNAEMQKAIMMSMESGNESRKQTKNGTYKKPSNFAQELGDVDMSASFYRDLQLQEIYEEQFKKNRR